MQNLVVIYRGGSTVNAASTQQRHRFLLGNRETFSSFVLFERECHRNIYIQLIIFGIRVER